MRLVPFLLLPACIAESTLNGKGEAGGTAAFADTGGNHDADADVDADSDADAPPETESDYLKLAPAATDAFVFVASPERDTVTRIDVASLAVVTAKVGDHPSIVTTSADYTRAVTFNEGSDDVTILDAATMTPTTVKVRDDFNSMAMSTDGEWVMCWYDPEAESTGTTGGVQSFNEISFVRLDDGAHFPMAVGAKPHMVRWSGDGTRAIVVSDASLALIDLTAATPAPTLIPIADDPQNAPPAEEVELSPSGAYAFVRQFGADAILVVDLANLDVTSVPVGENPTDLDVSPDGQTVAVVARTARQLWSFDATNPFAAPSVVDFPSDNAYGSLLYAGDGTNAVLYTTATALAKFGVWNTATNVVTEKSLVKPVASMGISPTGGSLLVFHTKTDAEDADDTSAFYNHWALTLLNLADFRSNPMVLENEPTSYTVSDDGSHGYFIMDKQNYLESLNFETLLVDEVALPSTPVHIGVLPGSNLAYASQEHDLGRLSFYNPDIPSLDTITGFELNAEIDHE